MSTTEERGQAGQSGPDGQSRLPAHAEDGEVSPTAHEPIADPGLPEHELRPTDVDPAQERRAERQVASMFGLASLLALGFCVAYFTIPLDASIGGWFALNTVLGLLLAGALLLIGFGAIHWAKKLMNDQEIIEMRHPARSSDEDREETLGEVNQGISDSGFGRRPLIRNSLLGALGVLGLPAIVLLRDLGPLPDDKLFNTVWGKQQGQDGMRVVNDVNGVPLKPGDIQLGQLVNAEPAILFETDSEGEHVYEGAELLQAKAKAAVILVRMRPNEINPPEGRENWDVDGILCFSKICTHVGCPISLYEQQTHHVLCPCHQSTFDLTDGAEVIFGPATRPLPQLPLAVDSEGYLIATSDFKETVGGSFPEMSQDR